MTTKIKVLQDTPFDRANTMLSLQEFRYRYNYFVNEDNSYSFLIKYIKEEYKNDNLGVDLSKWFEVIEENNFKIGDWVWHETLKQALELISSNADLKTMHPHSCTIGSCKTNPDIYKRLATREEQALYKLTSFCNGDVLIGEYKCYYFNNIWKEIVGLRENIIHYYECYKKPTPKIKVIYDGNIDNTFLCFLNGLKVGCKEISHQDVVAIANILKIY